MMSIIYEDQFGRPEFEEIWLNGKERAWNLLIEGEDDGDEITFQNSDTVDDWLAEVVEAAAKVGISLNQTRGALRRY